MTDFNGVKTEDEFSMKRRYESKAECQMYMDVYKYDIYKKYINTNDEMYKFKYSIIKCKKSVDTRKYIGILCGQIRKWQSLRRISILT